MEIIQSEAGDFLSRRFEERSSLICLASQETVGQLRFLICIADALADADADVACADANFVAVVVPDADAGADIADADVADDIDADISALQAWQ